MLRRLGEVIARRARWFALAWVVATVLGLAGATGSLGNESLFSRLSAGDVPTVPGESRTGADLLAAAQSQGPSVLLLAQGLDPADPAVVAALTAARPDLARIRNVVGVTDPLSPPLTPSPFVSSDGESVLVSVSLADGLDRAATDATIDTVTTGLERLGAGLTGAGADRIMIGGVRQLVDEINHHVETDLRKGEAVALPLSLLVMLVVFSGLLAAGLPILGAVASIAGGLACLLGFSYLIDLDASVPSVVSILGLGLCIDYGLLLASRFREELRAAGDDGGPGPDAVRRALATTLDTAGRTILFSGVTVAISLAGLLFFRSSILRAVGAAGTSVVVVAVLVALTFVPALLALAGPRMIRPGVVHRIPLLRRLAVRLGDVAPVQGAFSTLAAAVQRRPVLVLLIATAALLAAAWPVTRMQVTSSGYTLLPTSSQQRQLFAALEEDFPAVGAAPIRVVSRAPAEDLAAWGREVAGLPGVASVDPVRVLGEGAAAVSELGVRTTADPRLGEARSVVDRLREQRPDFPVWVTGDAAQVHDVLADIKDRAPPAVGVVVLATFVLLFLMTGSVLIPLKALVMNTISLGASFGVLVWIFQDGHLEGLLNFTSNGGIDQNIPALALAFAFGLAMDYEVFLLARVKEIRERLLDRDATDIIDAEALAARHAGTPLPSLNDLAVRYGLQRSGRIITSAGLIMVIVFGGFVAGDLLIIKQIGVALAVAVAVDASVVRMLLVPATMTVLGERNWWAPPLLRRLHRRFGLSEG